MQGLLPRAKELGRSGLRAMNRTLSPFSWCGRRRWFAEPPHMSVSMIHLPGTETPPRPGSELLAELRHTATHFDRVALVNGDGPGVTTEAGAADVAPTAANLLPRQDAAGARPVWAASSSSSS
jgi:hypothetical protein